MNAGIQYKLYHHEEIPPPSVWQKIEEELVSAETDLSLKEKLYSQQVTPPLSVWAAIELELSAGTSKDLSNKLYEAEVIPPAAAWKNIEAVLTSGKLRRMPPVARYAVAAALIGLLGFGALKLFAPSSTAGVASNDIKTTPVTNSVVPVANNNNTVNENTVNKETAATEEAKNDAALEQSKKTYAKVDISRRHRTKVVSNYRFASIDDGMIADNNTDVTNRYIVLMTPEGNFIRVSKKLGDLVCCVSGEEQDKDCKLQVDKWRKQIASANHGGNFGDIMSLLSSLQQDN